MALILSSMFSLLGFSSDAYIMCHSGNTVGPEIGILAEMASLQLEYTYLAKVTGKKQYFDRVSTFNCLVYCLLTNNLIGRYHNKGLGSC